MEPRPIIIITGKQRHHEQLLLAFSVVAGVAFLLGAPRSAVTQQLDEALVNVWAAGLAVSGVVGLAGCFWRNNLGRGLLLERSGMLIGAAAVFGFAVQVYAVAGGRGLFTSGFYLAWALANVARSLQISKDLRDTRGARGAGRR